MYLSKQKVFDFLKACFLPLIVFLAVFLVLSLFGHSQMHARSEPVSLAAPLLPQPIASFGAAVADQWLYIYGGHTGKTHQHSTENVSGAFFRLNLLDQKTWELLPGGPPVQSVNLVAHGGKIYRIGGMTARNAPGEPEDLYSLSDVARYDPATRKWETLAALPEPRSSHDTALLDNKLYVAGGWQLKGKEQLWHRTAYVMDLTAPVPRWNAIAALSFDRRALALAGAHGKLYAIGGMSKDGVSQQVDIYDPQTNRWSQGPDLPGNGFGPAATTAQGNLYVSGMEGVLYRLNPTDKRWESVHTLSFPRFFHRLVALGDTRLAAIGGAAPGGHLRNIEVLDVGPSRATPTITSWIVPFSGDAKNRQTVFLHDNDLLLVGGNNSLEQHDFSPGNFVNQAFKIHLGSLSVSRLADLPVNRQSLETVLSDGKTPMAYVVGGFGHDGEKARSFSDVFRYDLENDRWEKLAINLPSPRSQFGLVKRNSHLWIFGGLDYDPKRGKDAFQHPLEILSWKMQDAQATFVMSSNRLPRPRRAFGGAMLGDRYYLVGGMQDNFQLVQECDVFNFSSGQWETIPAPKQQRISPRLVALNGKLYLTGGSSPTANSEFQPNSSIEVFDPAARTWSTLVERIPISPSHLHVLTLRDRLLLYSANSKASKSIRILLIDPGVAQSGRPAGDQLDSSATSAKFTSIGLEANGDSGVSESSPSKGER